MTVRNTTVSVTTAADGTATAYSPRLSGALSAIHYIKDGSTPYSDTVDFTITLEATGEAVLSVSNVTASTSYYPRVPTSSTAGVAAVYAAAGTAVNDMLRVGWDRFKIVLAQGGNALTGKFIFVTQD